MQEILDHSELLSTEVIAHAPRNRYEGVGVSETPRGTLFHHYKVKGGGLLTWANFHHRHRPEQPPHEPDHPPDRLFSHMEPDDVGAGLGVPRFDVEGGFHWVPFGRLIVANVCFPTGSGRLRDNSSHPIQPLEALSRLAPGEYAALENRRRPS